MTGSAPPSQRARALAVFALILAAHFFFLNEYPNFPHPNTRSRLYLTLALAEEGRFEVDAQVARYGLVHDLARHGDHTYSDKPPGASVLLAPLAWILRFFVPISPDPTPMLVALRLFGVSLPSVGFWLATRRFWYRVAGSAERGLALILAGALGTSFFVYATQLFNHVPAAILLFAAWRSCAGAVEAEAPDAAARTGARPFAVAGLAGGIGFAVDHAIALGLAVLFAWAVLARRERRFARALTLAGGAALPALLLLGYNAHCFGSPFATGFQFVVDPYYADAYREGLLGLRWPDPGALFGLTLGAKRGLFYLSPFLLLAWPGFRALWRESALGATAPVGIALGIVLFAATTVDWESGWSVGSRYVVAAVPFLLVGVAAALARAPDGGAIELAFRATACAGVALIGLASATFPHFPKAYSHPLWQLAWPLLAGGHLTRNLAGGDGAAVLVPWVSLCSAGIALLAFGGFGRERAIEWRRGAVAIALAALLLVAMAWTSTPGAGPYLQEATKGVLLRMGEAAANER
jgi:hypothetical protein